MFNESIYAFMLWIFTAKRERGDRKCNIYDVEESLSTEGGKIKSEIKFDYSSVKNKDYATRDYSLSRSFYLELMSARC